MARIDTLGNFLTDVADSLKAKLGIEGLISAEDFDTEISSISKIINNQDKTITNNGTYSADQGYTGFDEVVVDVITTEYNENLAITKEILGLTN